jgi:glycosyltransferase involved in cell wall biosynthesis
MTAAISVVIPTYNGARFLADTIATVRAQTLQPVEIIVVDDGSTDDSAAAAAACGVTVIRQVNGGIGAARNTGILAATQPWVALLDHDDMWEREKLERQWHAAQRFPEAVLIATDCAVMNVNGSVRVPSFAGREIVDYDRLSIQDREGDCVLHPNAFDELAETGWFLMPSACLVKKDVLVRAGLFDVRTQRWEDTSCFLRVLKHGPLAFVQRPLCHWVIHGRNSSEDARAMLRGFLQLHDIMRVEASAYPPSYLAKMERERPDVLLDLARAALSDRSVGDPFQLALESFRLVQSRRAAGLLLAALLPNPVVARLINGR